MRQQRNIGDEARGKWRGILSALGISESYLVNKHGPCPICQGGKDRFRFDDRDARGTWFCSQCGAGDGLSLLMKKHGWDFKMTAGRVGELIGSVEASLPKAERPFDQRRACKQLWSESKVVTQGDPVARYLHRRLGLSVIPSCLRYVERLHYKAEGEPESWHPAMIALIRDSSGAASSIHRTYLTDDGQKANVASPKKMMRGTLAPQSAVRLATVANTMGIAEGIETALASGLLFRVPTWAAISAGLMEKWMPPESITKLFIFGDADSSFTGHAVSYALARRIVSKRPDCEVTVKIPEQIGNDWADVLTAKEATA